MKTILVLPADGAPREKAVHSKTDEYEFLVEASKVAGIDDRESKTIWSGATKGGRGRWLDGTASLEMYFEECGLMQGLPRNKTVPSLVGTIFVVAMETSEDGDSYRFHDFDRYLTKDSILAATELWTKGRIVDECANRKLQENAARFSGSDLLKGINVKEYQKMEDELRQQVDALARND